MSYRRTANGIQIYDVEGFPDGTLIPYDYDIEYDTSTPEHLKQRAYDILQMAMSENQSDTRQTSMRQTGGVSGKQPVELMDSKGNAYLNSGWNALGRRWDEVGRGWTALDKKLTWFDRSEPPSIYKRNQKYASSTTCNRSKPRAHKKTTKSKAKR